MAMVPPGEPLPCHRLEEVVGVDVLAPKDASS
jgi:hypothetical protein